MPLLSNLPFEMEWSKGYYLEVVVDLYIYSPHDVKNNELTNMLFCLLIEICFLIEMYN